MSVQTEECPTLECPNDIFLHHSFPTINPSGQATHQFRRFLFHWALCYHRVVSRLRGKRPSRGTLPGELPRSWDIHTSFQHQHRGDTIQSPQNVRAEPWSSPQEVSWNFRGLILVVVVE